MPRALFIIAVVWPIQKSAANAGCRSSFALAAITIVVTVTVCFALASLAAWGFGRVARALLADIARYQALYASTVTMAGRPRRFAGRAVGGAFQRRLDAARDAICAIGCVNTTLTFWIIALVYVMLGIARGRELRPKDRAAAGPVRLPLVLLDGSAATAAKLRRYLVGANADERRHRPAGRVCSPGSQDCRSRWSGA